MSSEPQIEVVIPVPDLDGFGRALHALTRKIHRLGLANGGAGGLFGGAWGYGANFENETFLMHRFCWCERDGECPWCTGCTCPQDNWIAVPGKRWPKKVRSTCPYCTGTGIFSRFNTDGQWRVDGRDYYDPPNFWYKPTDLRLTWYKYIGRDMESNRVPHDWREAILGSMRSLRKGRP